MKLIFKLLIGTGAALLLYVGGSFAYITAKYGKTPLVIAHDAQLATADMLSEKEIVARLAKDPKDVVAHCGLAYKAFRKKDYETAARERKLALEREPDNPQILMDLALDLIFVGHNDEAKIYCQKVIKTQNSDFAPTARKMLVKLEKTP